MRETIGFIGLGLLGLPMATNLLESGYGLRVYNRTASKAEPLLARGAILAATPADTATPGGIVASIVWDDAALESIVTSDGFLDRLEPGGIHVGMATVRPETSRKIAALHAEHGSTYVEATVFGRPEAAVGRALAIPVAGPQAAKDRVRPLLEALGGSGIYDLGEAIGAAAMTKLVGNFMIISMAHSMQEALEIAAKNGADPKAVINMLTNSLFNAPIFKSYGARIVDQDVSLHWSAIPLKDVGLLKAAGQQVDAPTPIASLMLDLVQTSSQT